MLSYLATEVDHSIAVDERVTPSLRQQPADSGGAVAAKTAALLQVDARTAPPAGGGGIHPYSAWRLQDSDNERPPVSTPTLAIGSAAAACGRGENGVLFRPPPLSLTSLSADYSPPSPRLYPSVYSPARLHSSPYFSGSSSSAPAPSPSAPYFFPFPPPTHPYPPPSHYLQIESYSAILASMGGGVGGGGGGSGHPPPPRPTPIFSVSPAGGTPPSHFGMLSQQRTHPPAPCYPSGTPDGMQQLSASFLGPRGGNASAAAAHPLGCARPSSTSTTDGTTPSPCHSPSYHHKYPCGKEGSLKHRILTRPGSEPDAKGAVQEPQPVAAAVSKRSRPPSPGALAAALAAVQPAAVSTLVSSTPVLTQALAAVPPSSTTTISCVHPPSTAGSVASPLGEHGDPQQGRRRPAACHHNLVQQQQQLQYPSHFMKGSIIQLASGELKCVEDLCTEDFVSSAELSADLQIDSSTVMRIDEKRAEGLASLSFLVGDRRIQVAVEASLEHPFFVFGQGWSSCSPERTSQRYALSCHQLQVGDVCISLTHRQRTSCSAAAVPSFRLRPALPLARFVPGTLGKRRKRWWSASDALSVDVGPSVEQRSSSLADAHENAP